MLPVHPIRCSWGVCLKQNPHIFQHLRSATLHSFIVVWWHPCPVPTPAPCGRLQIASLIRRTCPGAPFTTVQMAYLSPVHANPGRYSLKPLSRAPSVAFANHCLAACEGDVPCSICCMSIGLDLRTCSRLRESRRQCKLPLPLKPHSSIWSRLDHFLTY
jgi:hypothetical protein